MPRKPDRHPVLGTRVATTHRDVATFRELLPVNYMGVFEDSANKKRPRLGELASHTLFMGATGSGKTTAMKLHMWSILPPPDPRYSMRYRSLVYDPKTDLLPFFGRMGFTPEGSIIITNPFDRRSASWDVSADVTNEADVQSFAEILVGEQKGQEFWQAAAREIVVTTLLGLNDPRDGEERRSWDLRDLVTLLDSPPLLEQVLKRTPEGKGVLRDYLKANARMASSIRATLRANIAPYRIIAALWDHARYSFSFKDWSRGAGIILIGNHYKYREPMMRVNNLLVRYGVDSIMDKPGIEEHDLTWLYLDELRNAGTFPGFGTMMTQGRSKGIRAVLAVQGLATLQAAFPDGQEREVLNNCGNKAIMQLGGEDDAEWAERLFSTYWHSKPSWTIPNDSRHEGSRSFSKEKKSLLDAADFLKMPSASDHGGAITACYHGRGGMHSQNTVSGDDVDRAMPPEVAKENLPVDFIPRVSEQFKLRPFGPEDLAHLGLEAVEGKSAPGAKMSTVSTSSQPAFQMPPPPA